MRIISIVLIFLSPLAFSQDVEAIIDLGYEKYLEEDYEGAILDFNKALSYDDGNAEIYYLRGVSQSLLGKKKAAMTDLDMATKLNPDYAEAYYEKGYIYLSDQNAQEAIEEFDTVIELKPDFPEAYVSRGTAKCMLNDREGANADWQQAEELGVSYSDYMICE